MISFPELDDDSWQDFYRIRMVCELLNTVGELFQIAVPKKKMDYFLTYFMRFFWFKKEQWLANIDVEENDAPRFPADVEAAYVNMMAHVRPGQTLPVDLAEAEYLVEKQEEILKEKMDLPQDEDQEADEEVSRMRTVAVDRTLHPLTEEDEEDSHRLPSLDAPPSSFIMCKCLLSILAIFLPPLAVPCCSTRAALRLQPVDQRAPHLRRHHSRNHPRLVSSLLLRAPRAHSHHRLHPGKQPVLEEKEMSPVLRPQHLV